MTPELLAALTLAVFAVALLYASVGHAGASGYIAAMALLGVAPETIRPTALALNIVAATIASWQFWRAGHFRWALFWPFALPAVPCAFLGGWLALPAPGLKLGLGMVLLFSATSLLLRPAAESATRAPPLPVALATGGALGLLAGVTGTGGGIFLTPLLIHLKWSPTKTAAAVSALFILVNSVAGLAGSASAAQRVPALALPLALAVAVAAATGAHLGSRRFPSTRIRRCLATVLGIAGTKLALAVG